MPNEIGEIKNELTVDGCSIEILAHQIHMGYGGSDLDNWLEAQDTLKDKKTFSQEQVTIA